MSAPMPPPPPPMNNLKLGAPALGKSSNAVDPRSALLQSIQLGAILKKTTTVDKSGPLLSGRITNSDSSNSSNSNSTNSNAPSRPPAPMTNIAQQSGMPKLGGIFGGLTSMPKLKPVGARNNSRSSPSESPSSASSIGSPQNTSISSSTGSAVGDFSAELAKTLTLKKQKKQQQQESNSNSNSVSESVTRVNRGPPPQPPVKNPNTTVTDNNVKSAAAQSSPSIAKQLNSSKAIIPQNGINAPLLPNKSTLFGKSDSSNADVNNKAINPVKSNVFQASTNSSSITVSVTNKVVPNHGKPNCAPKPPGLIAAKNSMSPKSAAENSTRPGVARHHSWRSPRSPTETTAGMKFPATQQFGTIRITPNAKSQEAIHMTSMRPAPSIPISRPTVAPPRPPVEKNQPSPPAPPIRSVSNTNLSTLPLSVASVANTATNFGGSAGNVSQLSGATPAPPLPPHRLVPPVPPTRQTSITTPSNSIGAPPVPTRNSSMRNSNPNGQATVAGSTTTPKSSRAVNRAIIDLDAKFGHVFHNVTEFPSPQPFQNLKNGVAIGL